MGGNPAFRGARGRSTCSPSCALARVRAHALSEGKCSREVIWLLRHLKPDFKTIADFRRDNRNAFRHVFRENGSPSAALGPAVRGTGGSRRGIGLRLECTEARPGLRVLQGSRCPKETQAPAHPKPALRNPSRRWSTSPGSGQFRRNTLAETSRFASISLSSASAARASSILPSWPSPATT
jgi:hypothetical protein